MIISGGYNSRSVEVISPPGNVSCSLPKLPGDGRRDHTHDNSLICGGYPATGGQAAQLDSSNASFTCLNLSSSGWIETSHFLSDNYRHNLSLGDDVSWVGRTRHSSWPVDDGIILMGGYDPALPTNLVIITKIVKFDGTSEEAFGLKYSTMSVNTFTCRNLKWIINNVNFSDTCSIPDGNSVLLTGGFHFCVEWWCSGAPAGSKVHRYTQAQGWVEDLPDLIHGRYGHGCAALTMNQEQVRGQRSLV